MMFQFMMTVQNDFQFKINESVISEKQLLYGIQSKCFLIVTLSSNHSSGLVRVSTLSEHP